MSRHLNTVVLALLLAAFSWSTALAKEASWTPAQRESKRDVVIKGDVLKVTRSHALEANKRVEIWSAAIRVTAVHKGPPEIIDQTVTVLFPRGALIKGSTDRYKRCPAMPELTKGEAGNFFLMNCTAARLRQLEMDPKTKGAFHLEMGSDVIKSKQRDPARAKEPKQPVDVDQPNAAKLWVALSVSEPLVHHTRLKQFHMFFAIQNDGEKSIDPKDETWVLNINGKDHPGSQMLFGNGPRGIGRDSLSPGESGQFTIAIGSWFEKPGTYKVIWRGQDFETAPVVFRVLPKK